MSQTTIIYSQKRFIILMQKSAVYAEVIPVQAGIQFFKYVLGILDSRLRGNDNPFSLFIVI